MSISLTVTRYFFTQISRYVSQILMTFEFLQQIFQKYSNIKFHLNLSSGIRVVLYRRTDRRTTDMTKRIIAFRSFNKALKYHEFIPRGIVYTYIVYTSIFQIKMANCLR